MTLSHAASPDVVRFPPRLRAAPITVSEIHHDNVEPATARVETPLPGDPATTALSVKSTVTLSPQRLRSVQKWEFSTSALDALLSAGTIDGRQHAAGIAYAALRLRHDTAKHGGGGLSPERWAAVKRDNAALLATAGFDRFLLVRLCQDGEAPLWCEVERAKAALRRIAEMA